MLFHISEEQGIERFEPRPSHFCDAPVVWAVDQDHLRNYLVPRECPRVTYYAGPATTPADVDRFLLSSTAVVAIEHGWWKRLQACRLYCYHFPPETFECQDECAGYYVSHVAVVPERVKIFEDPMGELMKRGVELRALPNLWTLRDAVVASTLRYSIIRMTNALPRHNEHSSETTGLSLTGSDKRKSYGGTC